MYWVDLDAARPRIERAKLADGSQRQTIVDGVHLKNSSGLVIDYTDSLLYWVDGALDELMSSKLDGTDIKVRWKLSSRRPAALVRRDDVVVHVLLTYQ